MSGTGPGDEAPPVAPEAVLGIPPGATDQQIERAWRGYVKAHHPDRGGDAEAFRRGRAAVDALRASSGPQAPAPQRAASTRGVPSRRRLRVRRLRASLATLFPSLAPPPSRVD